MTATLHRPRELLRPEAAEELLTASQLFFDKLRQQTSDLALATAAIASLTHSPKIRQQTKERFISEISKSMGCISEALQTLALGPGCVMTMNIESTASAQVRDINYTLETDQFGVVIGALEGQPIVWPLESGSQLFLLRP